MSNHDDEPIDFSALDPARDQMRWEAQIKRVARLASARRATRPSVAALIVRWWKVSLYASAAAVTAVWVGTLVQPQQMRAVAQNDPVATMAVWARSGAVPSTGEIIALLENASGK